MGNDLYEPVYDRLRVVSRTKSAFDDLVRYATTLGHFKCPVGRNQKVLRLIDINPSVLIEINCDNGDYYGVYDHHWIEDDKVYLQIWAKAFDCGLRVKMNELITFSFTEQEFDANVYIHCKEVKHG